jgi:hypothetical protein
MKSCESNLFWLVASLVLSACWLGCAPLNEPGDGGIEKEAINSALPNDTPARDAAGAPIRDVQTKTDSAVNLAIDGGSGDGRSNDMTVPAASLDRLEPPCFDPSDAPACGDPWNEGTFPSPVDLARASDIGNGVRFTAIGGWAVLAERPDTGASGPSRWSVVLVTRPGDRLQPGPTRILDIEWPGAGAGHQILDVWGEYSLWLFGDLDVVALGCNTSSCAVLGASLESGEPLRPVPGCELVAPPSLDGVFVFGGRVCVFGDGLLCCDGARWTTEIAPGLVPRLRAVAAAYHGAYHGVAVGDGGTLLVRWNWGMEGEIDNPGQWTAIETGSDEALIGAEAEGGRFTVIGEDGLVAEYKRDSFSDESEICRQSPPYLFAIPGLIVLDRDGNLFSHYWKADLQRSIWCKRSVLDVTQFTGYSRAVHAAGHSPESPDITASWRCPCSYSDYRPSPGRSKRTSG